MLPTPNRLLVALLRLVSSRAAADAAIGDIAEEFQMLRGWNQTPANPSAWMNARIVKAAAAAMYSAFPKMLRTVGLVVRDAARSVRRSPAHSAFVVLILGLGIAVGTVTFSVVDAVLLKPLPFERPDEVVSIYAERIADQPVRVITPPMLMDLRNRSNALESMSPLLRFTGGSATVDGAAEYLDVATTSTDLFRVYRMTTAIGRVWTIEEENAGAGGVVLGYAFWKRRFGGDPNALGKSVTVGRRTLPIIGVLSAATDTPEFSTFTTPIWAPAQLSLEYERRSISLTARMRAGVTPNDVAAEFQKIAGTDWRPRVARVTESAAKDVRGWMLLALGAAVLVVLIACVNAANLLLARSSQRSQEMAVRSSLGASKARVAASLLAEGVILSAAATGVALVASLWTVSAARIALTTVRSVERANAISLNGRVLVAAILTAVVTGVLFAIVPAWHVSRASTADLLRDGSPSITRGGRRWRSAFLIVEMASVCVLVVVAWMFIGSLVKVMNVDLGIERSHLLAVKPRVNFGGTVDEVKARVGQISGVADVAVVLGASAPVFGPAFGGAWGTLTWTAEGASVSIEALDYRVTPNYFDITGIKFQRGGAWAVDAGGAATRSIVLDELAARRLFGETDPLGRRLLTPGSPNTYTVVGVAAHVRARGPEDDTEEQPAAYIPVKPDPARRFAGLLVRTSSSPSALVPVISDALKPFAPNQPEGFVFAADQAVSSLTRNRRFNATLMSIFGFAGLIIGAAGIFAVMASTVAQQTREIGVRVALGATPAVIRRDVLRTALRHIALGLIVGLPIAWWASRGFGALLFHVTPTDVSVYLGVAVLMSIVGVLSALIPARRAARVDPIVSLRS